MCCLLVWFIVWLRKRKFCWCEFCGVSFGRVGREMVLFVEFVVSSRCWWSYGSGL